MKTSKHVMHGLSHHRLNRIYYNMIKRCKPTSERHHRYYDRGITVCDEWRNSFTSFADWAFSNGYRDDLTLDRIDNDKGYSPGNCRWATPKEQSNNMRRNHLLSYNGEVHTMAEWARILGISRYTICSRIRLGWSIDKTLSTPTKETRGHI